jgi:alpha-D-xyloside xylohydrolase
MQENKPYFHSNMKATFLILLLMIPVLNGNCFSQETPEQSLFTKAGDDLEWENEGEVFRIGAFGQNTLRFRSSRSLHIWDEIWNILPQPDIKPVIQILPGKAIISNGNIRAEIRENDGLITYLNKRNEVLLKEAYHHHVPRFARQYKSRGSEHFELMLTFEAEKTEHLYGMGQYPNDCLDLKGTVLELAQKNTQISIPFLLSSKGYGFIWNNPSIGRADLSMTNTSFSSKYAKQIDYFIFAEGTPADLVRRYSMLSGKSPMMPAFATGLWQSKLRYSTQAELLSVAREYKKRNLPISVIVADFFHWPHSGDWRFDPKFWPDPAAMVKELDSMGIKLLVSVWPTVATESENYSLLVKKNYLIRPETGVNAFLAFSGFLTFVDVTNPEARQFMWEKIKKNYYDIGIRMFWLDEAEPEIDPLDYENVRYLRGNGLEVSSIYPFNFAQAFYEGQTRAGQKDIINLIRCGWIGSQRFGTVLWSGDIYGDFETLRRQVKAGLNISLCGIPWWNTDIGGFFKSKDTPEQFHEVLIRWFQFGAFCPVMRMHGNRQPMVKVEGSSVGSGAPNEVWSYGDETLKIMTRYLQVREQLKPYILKHMEIASREGIPMMRPLFFDFPKDQVCYTIEDQYMFGPDLLVAPVLEYMASGRKIYFPSGSNWTDALTGKVYKGGQTIDYKVTLENIPVFCKNEFDFRIK